MSGRFDGKLVLVTGAGLGIGLATSLAFAREGAEVVVAGRTLSRLERAVDGIKAEGGVAWPLQLDVSDADAWRLAVDAIEARGKPLDVLVNNAGVLCISAIEDTSLAAFHQVQRVNVDGVFLGLQAATRLMGPRGGAIVNVSSAGSRVAMPNYIAYSASKAAVDAMTRAAAIEFASRRRPIRVNSVQPGVVWTPMTEAVAGSRETSPLAPLADALHPMGRVADVEEVAAAILFLASDQASFTTGASLLVDGGLAAGIFGLSPPDQQSR
jgi:NAD(P)-dependent dehydrogenase (short-subunit alcohol dehydrogenase family)